MSGREAGIGAYLGYLKGLRDSGIVYFVEGGQAVNFWAEFIDARIGGGPLAMMRPFTSKDCDIWVSGSAWEKLKQNPLLRKGSSPADGQLGILTLSEEPPLVVDMLSLVYGIPVKDCQRLFDRAMDDGAVKVIDPISLFRSKCHCFLHLDQADRQDERHVRIMALVLPEYLSLLAGEVESGDLPARSVIREIKWLEKTVGLAACRRAMEMLGIAKNSLIPSARLKKSEAEELRRYAAAHDEQGGIDVSP